MTQVKSVVSLVTPSERSETLYEGVRALLPSIAAAAPAMERAGRLDDRLVEDLDQAGVFSIMVSRKWGGLGLGLRESARALRMIAGADVCTAWVASFYLFNHMLVQRFPMTAQARLFANGPSFRCAGVWAASGTAVPTEGGFRLSGRWTYASGIHTAEGALLAAMVDGEACWLIVTRDQLRIIDDWDVSAMQASGSATVIVEDSFVPADMCMPVARLISSRDHHGVALEESVHCYPFTRFGVVSTALAVGALECGVTLGKDRLATSRPYGVARIDKPWSRMSWAEAAQNLRMLTLLHEAALEATIERCERGHQWTAQEVGQFTLDNVSIYHGAKNALRLLLDGTGGSSIYKSSDPIQRMARDMGMIATHLLMGDYDVLWERGSRLLLGMTPQPGELV